MTHIADKENVYDKVDVLEEHEHSRPYVYPTLAAGETVVANGAANTLGVFKEIIPVNSGEVCQTNDFDIHWMNIEGASNPETFEIALYDGTTEIGRYRFTVDAVAGGRIGLPPIKMQTKIIEANSQIQAKVATIGGGESVTISLQYHTY